MSARVFRDETCARTITHAFIEHQRARRLHLAEIGGIRRSVKREARRLAHGLGLPR